MRQGRTEEHGSWEQWRQHFQMLQDLQQLSRRHRGGRGRGHVFLGVGVNIESEDRLHPPHHGEVGVGQEHSARACFLLDLTTLYHLLQQTAHELRRETHQCLPPTALMDRDQPHLRKERSSQPHPFAAHTPKYLVNEVNGSPEAQVRYSHFLQESLHLVGQLLYSVEDLLVAILVVMVTGPQLPQLALDLEVEERSFSDSQCGVREGNQLWGGPSTAHLIHT